MARIILRQTHDPYRTPGIRISRNSLPDIRPAFGLLLISAAVLLVAFQLSQTPTRSLKAAFAELPAEPTPQENVAVLDANASEDSRIIIGKIGVNMPIVEGTNEKVLFLGAWRSPWSSTPPEGGNTVLFGHRYFKKPPDPETFFELDRLSQGDEFEVVWRGASFRYRVTETKVVPPTDLSVLEQTDGPTITLITCTPLYTTKNRLIIRAERI